MGNAMMSRKLLILLVLLFPALIGAEERIQFLNKPYSVYEVIRTLEEQLHVQVIYPFSDEYRQEMHPEPTMDWQQVLGWVCRYDAVCNKRRIAWERKGEWIRFREVLRLSKEEVGDLVAMPLILKGQQWTVRDAMNSVEKQIGKGILLPFADRAATKVHYDYECKLGEFLQEVISYYREVNGMILDWGVEKDTIVFYDYGITTPMKSLRVEIVGAPPVLQDKEVHEPAPPILGKAKDRDRADEIRSFWRESNLAERIRAGALADAAAVLIAPRMMESKISELMASMKPYFREGRREKSWQILMLAFDSLELSLFEKKMMIEELCWLWLNEIQNKAQNNSPELPRFSPWAWRAGAGVVLGDNLEKLGAVAPGGMLPGGWGSHLQLQLQTEWKDRPDVATEWGFRVGAARDQNINNHQQVESAEASVEVFGSRRLGYQGLHSAGLSIKAMINDSIFGVSAPYDHHLLIGEGHLHWSPRPWRGTFSQWAQDTRIYAALLSPEQAENLDNLGMKRDTTVVGFTHRGVWLGTWKEWRHGPYAEIGLESRSSDSRSEEANISTLGFGWSAVEDHWMLQGGLDWRQFRRSDTETRLRVMLKATFAPWGPEKRWTLSAENEEADGQLPYENYDSRRIQLGMEWNW